MCACYDPELYMCCVECHAIFTGVYAMYFSFYVVTSTSMQSSLLNDADFRDLEFHCLCPVIIFMPYVHVVS